MDETCILLAAFQGERFLGAQLDSLAAQSDPDWRLIWRDDGSTDGTAALLQGFAAGPGAGRVRPFLGRPGRLGVLGSFMALLAAAPAEAARFAFCDQDDVWLPGKLARARAALGMVPAGQPALYCGRQRLVDEALRPLGLSPLPSRPAGFGNALSQNIATGCTLVLNAAARRAVLAAPPPPAGSLHDWWCYLVVTGIGGRVIFDPEPLLLYRQHRGNAVGAAAPAVIRARRALQRGPERFLGHMAAHLDALAGFEGLTPAARRSVSILLEMRRAGPLRRLWLLRRAGVYRQAPVEDALLRLWVALRRLPRPAGSAPPDAALV